MFKVYNVSWAGLQFHVATFSTEKESVQFLNDHKDYTLIIKDHNENTLKEQMANDSI